MEHRDAVCFVAAFLRENGFGLTLAALTEETHLDFAKETPFPGGELLRRLDAAAATARPPPSPPVHDAKVLFQKNQKIS
jgi:hypothetical protein